MKYNVQMFTNPTMRHYVSVFSQNTLTQQTYIYLLSRSQVFQNKRHLVFCAVLSWDAATLCFQRLLRPCDSSSAVGRVEEKGNYSLLFHFYDVHWRNCVRCEKHRQRPIQLVFDTRWEFFFCRVADWNEGFFTACLVFVLRMCKQKTFSECVGQMETIDDLEKRRRSMQAGRHSDDQGDWELLIALISLAIN